MKTENFKKPTGTLLYFAYGSNMNLNQMAFRCPDAEVVDTVRLEGYRLAFCMNGGGNGVATILPEEGSYVDGVLWRISERDERHLDHYEGFPYLYGKEPVVVMYTAIAPIPMSTFAGEPTSNVGKNFLRSYAGVCLEGAIIALACIIFSVMASSPPAVDPNVSAVTAVWSYVGELIFNLLVLVGAVRMSDRIVKEL